MSVPSAEGGSTRSVYTFIHKRVVMITSGSLFSNLSQSFNHRLKLCKVR